MKAANHGAASSRSPSQHLSLASAASGAVRRLSQTSARAERISLLTHIRRQVVHTRAGLDAFVAAGGLPEICRILQSPQPAAVLNPTLSIMANCTARPAGRQFVLKNGGLHAVLGVLQVVADGEVCARACRTLANLAQEPELCRTLFLSDALQPIAALMASEEPPPSHQLRTAAIRLWRHMADTGSHQRTLLRVEVAEHAARALSTADRALKKEALRLLAHLAAGYPRDTGTQMQQVADAFPTLLSLCGTSAELPAPQADEELSDDALKLTLSLARQSCLRPVLGQHGMVRMLRDAAERSRNSQTTAAEQRPDEAMDTDAENVVGISSEVASLAPSVESSTCASLNRLDRCSIISALCLFSWESVNRARFRSLGILPWLVELLGDEAEPAALRRRVLHALYQFVYDEAGFAQMKSAGVICVLVKRLQAMVDTWKPGKDDGEDADETDEDVELEERHGSAGADDSFRADSPTYRQVEREMEDYLRQVKNSSDSTGNQLCKTDFSPSGSLSSCPRRSPDASPPFWCSSGGGFSPDGMSSRGSWQWSPQSCGPASPPLSPAGSFSPPTSPPSSTSPAASDQHSFSSRLPRGRGAYPLQSSSVRGAFSPEVSPTRENASPFVSLWRAGAALASTNPNDFGGEAATTGGSSADVPRNTSPLHHTLSSFKSIAVSPRMSSPAPSVSNTPRTLKRCASDTNPHRDTSSPHTTAFGKRARTASTSSDPPTAEQNPQRGGDEESWLLLLLSRESQMERPDAVLYAAESCNVLVEYLQYSPNPQQRACRILARLARNPSCFRSLAYQQLASRVVRRVERARGAPFLDSMRAVAESGYGQGVLESMLELGGAAALAAVTTAATVVRVASNLRRLLLARHGLDILLDNLAGANSDGRVACVNSLSALVEHLAPPLPAVSDAMDDVAASVCQYRAVSGRYDVTLIMSDGEVQAHRQKLAAGGPVLSALLSGGFREASASRVPLGDMSRAVAEALVHVVYGCALDGCPLLRHLRPPLWLPLLAAADRFLLTEPADALNARVLDCRDAGQLAQLYRSARRQQLQLDEAGSQLHQELLQRLLRTGCWGGAPQQLSRLLRSDGTRLVDDVRQLVIKLLEPVPA